MERRFITTNCEFIEERAAGAPSRFTGLASVYYCPEDEGTQYTLWDIPTGKAVERIHPGAFDRAIREQDDVVATFNHDMNWPLADTPTGTLTLVTEPRGLRYRFDFNPDDPQHQIMRAKATQKLVRQSSFAFTVDEGGDFWTRENGIDVRNVYSVKLHDVSMVTRGAYSSSTVGMRSAESVDDAKSSYLAYQTKIRQEICKNLIS